MCETAEGASLAPTHTQNAPPQPLHGQSRIGRLATKASRLILEPQPLAEECVAPYCRAATTPPSGLGNRHGVALTTCRHTEPSAESCRPAQARLEDCAGKFGSTVG